MINKTDIHKDDRKMETEVEEILLNEENAMIYHKQNEEQTKEIPEIKDSRTKRVNIQKAMKMTKLRKQKNPRKEKVISSY